MVVINKEDISNMNRPPVLERSSSTNGNFVDANTSVNSKSSSSGSCFNNDCDARGMLRLNQELVINKGDVFDFFRMDKGPPCATGLYAQVKRCRSLKRHNSRENVYFAAKFSPRRRPGQAKDEECLENLHEIALLCRLQHPYIITFKDAFILQDCVVTIMEFAPGGDLQSVIDADLVLLEKDASRYIYQLLEALKYLHQRHIAHLDIKPQNLLLMGEFPTCDIKLCDFEISRMIKPGKEIKEILGTPDYVAPEILLYEPLSTGADMWSVGILCYVLLTGFSPFGGDTDQETFRNIIHEPIDFPDELFDDVSPAAIDFIVRVAVKNAKSRPSATEMEEHEWVKTFIQEVTPIPEPLLDISLNHTGPKKRSPRKMAMAGSSTASASGRRPSARAILRACKSDLYQLGGKTKSREALVEKMKLALGEPSGSNWKFRINLSKSREQLWESKIQLSKSCERINQNLDSTRWASVANFPSLDLGAGALMKSATSQESVISVMSTCTNIGTGGGPAQELLDWQQQSLLDDFVGPTCSSQQNSSQYKSISMPNTPPIPNFDLSSPINPMIHETTTPMNLQYNNSTSDFNYPSLNVNGESQKTLTNDNDSNDDLSSNQKMSTVELESQKSVAELIMTFGGRVSGPNGKKLDLKNQFEPIMEGSEEQPMSFGDGSSDNNSTSGVSSIIASNAPTTKELLVRDKSLEMKNGESGNYSLNSSSSNELDRGSKSECCFNDKLTLTYICDGDGSSRNSSRRGSKTSQQIRDDMRSKVKSVNSGNVGHNNICYSIGTTGIRRGIKPPPRQKTLLVESPAGLKGILKKSTFVTKPAATTDRDCNIIVSQPQTQALLSMSSNLLNPPGPSSRRGSIPGNCTRLHDTHTISSLAKVPKRSILKIRTLATENVQQTNGNGNKNKLCPSEKSNSIERASSKSPENTQTLTNKDDTNSIRSSSASSCGASEEGGKNETNNVKINTILPKIIPKGLSPRERPSFILLSGPDHNKSKVRGKSPQKTTLRGKSQGTNKPGVVASNSPTSCTTTSMTKRQMIKSPESSFDEADETNSQSCKTNGKIVNNKPLSETVSTTTPAKEQLTDDKIKKNSKFKSELQIEPAAVAIKIFPPDPLIIPKSCVLLLKSGLSQEPNNDDDDDKDSNTFFSLDNNIDTDSIAIYNNNNNNNNIDKISSNNDTNNKNQKKEKTNKGVEKSSEERRKSKGGGAQGVVKRSDKPMWGIVCTGSVGRAMERFETGVIKGKKLRRGSVPDF